MPRSWSWAMKRLLVSVMGISFGVRAACRACARWRTGDAGRRYRSRLWHKGAQQLTSVVMGPGFRQDDGCVCEQCAMATRIGSPSAVAVEPCEIVEQGGHQR